LEKRLADVRRDLGTRQDTSGDRFVMTLEGQEIRDRGIAGELLLRRAERMKGSRTDRQVGAFAGFQVFVADNFMQGPEIVLKGATTHVAKVTDTALGTIRSVEYAVQHLDELVGTLEQNIADTRKRLADTQAQVETPFEYADKLAALVQRQQEIMEALDLTKNEAGTQMEAEDETAAVETPANTSVVEPSA
jgi:hypothetical protein